MARLRQVLLVCTNAGLLLLTAGCRKAPEVRLSVSPTRTESGGSVDLRWESRHASRASMDHGIGLVPPSGSRRIRPERSAVYTITAQGKGGRFATAEASVEIANRPAVIERLEADPQSVSKGDAVLLRWQTNNALKAWLDNGIGTVALNGSLQVRPGRATVYRLSAQGAAGEVAEADVRVGIVGEPSSPPSVQLRADPERVASGEVSLLHWKSQGASRIWIDHGIGQVSRRGSTEVRPAQTTRYRILAESSDGQVATAEATVSAVPPPAAVSMSAYPRSIRRGESSRLTWQASHAEEVRISPEVGLVLSQGTIEVSPVTTTRYTISTRGHDGGTAVAAAEVAVQQHSAPAVSLTASPEAIEKGGEATLKWRSQRGRRARIEPAGRKVGLNGELLVQPGVTTTYSIEVEDELGQSASDQFTIRVQNETPSGEPEGFREILQREDLEGHDMEYLIGLVPDPIDSNLPRQFDLYLSAISRAAESKGYIRERFWLPWAETRAAHLADCLLANPGGDEAACKAAWTDAASRRVHRSFPGVIYFRHTSEDRYLMLFLVGESPAWGIQSRAIDVAVQKIEHYLKERSQKQIRILGPSFSGSSASLGAYLRDYVGPAKFRVVSGAASAQSVNTKRLNRPPLVTYDSMASDSSVRIATLTRTLDTEFGIPPSSIAMLVESSVYGGAAIDRDAASPSDGESDAAASKERADAKISLTIPFPMHISHVRDAYSREAATSDLSEGRPRLPFLLSDRLRVQLAGPGHLGDGLPLFGGSSLSPQSFDLVMGRILSEIDHRKLMAVGIVATNVRDRLFLANEIHKHAPNVRLFTVGGDIMLAHPQYISATRGMIIASSNSLFFQLSNNSNDSSASATTSADSKTHYHFATDAEHGVFLAFQRLLEPDPDSGAPRKRSIWLSVVGRGELLPFDYCEFEDGGGQALCLSDAGIESAIAKRIRATVSFILSPIWPPGASAASPGADASQSATEVLHQETVSIPDGSYLRPDLPRGWIFLCLILLVFFFVAAFKRRQVLRLVPDDRYVFRHVSILLFLVSALWLILVSPILRGMFDRFPQAEIQSSILALPNWGYLSFIVPSLLVFLGLAAAIAICARKSVGSKGGRMMRILIYAPGFALIGVTAEVLLQLYGGTALQFSADRMLALSSGVSPAIPLFVILSLLTAWLLLIIFRVKLCGALTRAGMPGVSGASESDQTALADGPGRTTGEPGANPAGADSTTTAESGQAERSTAPVLRGAGQFDMGFFDPLRREYWTWARIDHTVGMFVIAGGVIAFIYLVVYYLPVVRPRLFRSLEGSGTDLALLIVLPVVFFALAESLRFAWRGAELARSLQPAAAGKEPMPAAEAEAGRQHAPKDGDHLAAAETDRQVLAAAQPVHRTPRAERLERLVYWSVGLATLGSAALLLMVSFYPFQPVRFIMVYVSGCVLFSAFVGAFVLTKKLPGGVDKAGKSHWPELTKSWVVAGAAPLISFVISLVPGAGQFVGALLEPLLGILK